MSVNEWGCEGRRRLGFARGALTGIVDDCTHAESDAAVALEASALPGMCPELSEAKDHAAWATRHLGKVSDADENR